MVLAQTSGADLASAWGQVLGAAFTLAAVVVALWLAGRDGRIAAAAERRRAETQARLVVTNTPGVQDQGPVRGGFSHDLAFFIVNHGDRPILDVRGEAWPPHVPLDQANAWGFQEAVLLPGKEIDYLTRGIETPDQNLGLQTWRYRWTDADGNKWFVDARSQLRPAPFHD